ncbi:hypothetical protein D3C78_1602450 [compost metagenome]
MTEGTKERAHYHSDSRYRYRLDQPRYSVVSDFLIPTSHQKIANAGGNKHYKDSNHHRSNKGVGGPVKHFYPCQNSYSRLDIHCDLSNAESNQAEVFV